MRAEDYTFSMIPDPLAATKRVGGPAKRVWTCIYSWRRMGREQWKLTGQRLSRIVNIDRRHLQRTVEELEEAGLLEYRVITQRNGSKRTEYRDLWPGWLSKEGARFLLAQCIGSGSDEDEDAFERCGSEEVCTVPHTVEEEEVCIVPHTVAKERKTPCSNGAPTMFHGVSNHVPTGRTIKSPSRESPSSLSPEGESEESSYLDDSAESSRFEGDPTSTGTVNLDDDSPEARDVLELQRVQRAERREALMKRPRVRKVTEVKSGEEFRNSPSSRPEWNAWRDKNVTAWTGRDLVGFWVCRFREVRGAEDPDFSAASLSVGYAPAAMRLVKQFVSLNLGSAVKYRDLVERVLAEAEALGRPVSLRYWFGTPSNPRTLASLDKGKGGREMSPAERNDLDGANLELHERRGREWYERQLEKDREDAAVGR